MSRNKQLHAWAQIDAGGVAVRRRWAVYSAATAGNHARPQPILAA